MLPDKQKKKFTKSVVSLVLLLSMLIPLVGCGKTPEPATVAEGTDKTLTTTKKQSTLPVTDDKTPVEGELVINEIMVSNKSTLADSYGEYPDWIEIHNTTAKDISLGGCYLSDDAAKPKKWDFPDINIKAGGYLVVFASDRGAVTESGELHTGFKLSAGESVILSYKSKTLMSLTTPATFTSDISYGIIADGDEYQSVFFAQPTPGAENGGKSAAVLSDLNMSEIGLRINEYMTKNVNVFYDEDGDAPDWAELVNISDSAIALGGYGLSDDYSEPLKWIFPDITLEAGEYLVICLSGKSKEYDPEKGMLHAGFKLSSDDDGLLLSTPTGLYIDNVDTVALPESVSYGRSEKEGEEETGTRVFFALPTPGAKNTSKGFSSLDAYLKADTQKVFISEVCAVSSTSVDSLPDDDWIELYNNTDETVNLSGWSLSKYTSNLRYYVFPDITVKPHACLVIKAGGVASYQVKTLNTGFKVGFSGEMLYLTDKNGRIVDCFESGVQRAGITSGRVIENEVLTRAFFSESTKGSANTEASGTAFTSYAAPAVIESSAGVLIADNHVITLSTKENKGEIYYTTDGNKPDKSSALYTGPFALSASASVRAVVYADGMLPSDIVTRTFIIDAPHSLNVVCLTSEPDDLFGYEDGIWADGAGWVPEGKHQGANYWMDWERETYFEFYETDGSLGVGFSAGIKNHGQYSRANAQKSVSVNLKEAYGSSSVWYPFFGEGKVAEFKNLLLRTGCQDWGITNLKDAFCASVIAGQMDLDYMEVLPVAVYVNGQYWGLYYLREKINESYIYSHSGIEADNLDAIKGNRAVETGSYDNMQKLVNYMLSNTLETEEKFNYVANQIDLQEWINYWVTETYLANTDTGNIRFYCSRDGEGKWRWILFDLDWALFRSTYTYNMIEEFLDPVGHGSSNRFSTLLARRLMSNAAFKTRFIENYAYYMQTVFKPERMIAVLDEMVALIADEMPRQYERWNILAPENWNKNISKLKQFITERYELSKGDLQETFGLSNEYMKELFPND